MNLIKNIFFVHSNITIYLAKHYIEKNSLDPLNIIIFYARLREKDVIALPGKKVDFLNIFYFEFVNKGRNLFEVFYRVCLSVYRVNRFLSAEVKSDYNLFVPHLFWDVLQLLATNSKCKKITFMEEGDMTYVTENELLDRAIKEKELNIRTNDDFKRRVLSLNQLLNFHPFPKVAKKQEAICLHPEAFPFPYIDKKVYNFKKVFCDKTFQFSTNYHNSVIFVLENISALPEGSNLYLKKFQETLSYIKKMYGNKVFLKPHPAQLKNSDKLARLLEIVKQANVEYDIINDPIELVLVNYENVKIFCHRSSIIRYCFYAEVKPYVWGVSLFSEIDRKRPFYKFMEKHREVINVID